MKRLLLLLSINLICLAAPITAANWYVAPAGDDANSGISGSPFATIQHAVNTSANGDTVFVLAGSYSENVDFSGKLVKIVGADNPSLVEISANDSSVPVFTFTAGENSSASLYGLTIQNTASAPGVLCNAAGPVINNCRFATCTNSGNGGAISLLNGASANIQNSEFIGNAAAMGGALYIESSNPIVSYNTFDNNNAACGGAVVIGNNANPTITYNLFIYNSSAQEGGALSNMALFGPTVFIRQNTFYRNDAGTYGGAIYSDRVLMVVEKSILWDDNAGVDGDEAHAISPGRLVISYCDIAGGWTSGVGNSDVDPMFCDPDNGDFHLQDVSYVAAYPFASGNFIGAFEPGCIEVIEDLDGDGIADDEDNCPDIANTDQADSDGDGIGDLCDNCPDFANADQADSDGDGIGDLCDNCPDFANADQADSDGDGIGDLCDNCPDFANADQADSDGDGIGDLCDNCPDFANADQADADGDGIGDLCDNCPDFANADQADADGDGIGDLCDNCPDFANADQADADGDGIGDLCDNCPDFANADQADSDGDGIGDLCDNCPDFANADQADSDGDGIGDLCDNDDENVTASIYGYIVSDSGAIGGVKINLLNTGYDIIAATESDNLGYYEFTDIPSGDYVLYLWPPQGLTSSSTIREVELAEEGIQEDFELYDINGCNFYRGRGFWMVQLKRLIKGWGHPHVSQEEMCNYIEMIRIFFNSHPNFPIQSVHFDEGASCQEQMEYLYNIIRPQWRHKGRIHHRARAHFAVLLLNIVSGRILPWACIDGHRVFGNAENGPSGSNPAGITVAQALIYTDRILSDGDDSNDETAYLIDSLLVNDQPVPPGLIPPETPNEYYMTITDITEDPVLPGQFSVAQNYPNPFNPTTTIAYSLGERSEVTVEIFNVLGNSVRSYDQGTQAAGIYSIEWDGTDHHGRTVGSGIYFYRVTAGEFRAVRKMMLVK